MKKRNLGLLCIGIVLILGVIIFGIFRLKTGSVATTNTNPPSIEYQAPTIKSNNNLESCFMAIGGVVYNLTFYIQNHPEQKDNLCGQIEPDLKALNLKVSKISGNKIGILSP